MIQTASYGRLMLFVGSVLALAAAVIHVLLFVQDHRAWVGRVRSERQAAEPTGARVSGATGLPQRYYDLFLAVGVIVGLVVLNAEGGARLDIVNPNNYVERNGAYGVAVVSFGLTCMVAASVALKVSERAPLRDVAVRGLVPALGLIALAVAASSLEGV